jgi:mycothiol synthase
MDGVPVRERPASRDDLQAVTDLYCAYEQAVRGAPDTDPDDVAADWDSPGVDMATSTLVLEQGGRLVGYAVLLPGGEADSCAIPDRRGSDVERRLLAWLEEQGGARRLRVEHYVPDVDEGLSALVRSRGWQPERHFWRMRRELDGPLPEPVWPEGAVVRDHARPEDDAAVHALITSAQEIGGQHERTLEQWRAALLDTPRFDPGLCLVVHLDGRLAGAAISQSLGDLGFVRQLAVAPEQRGRGVAKALLHELFRRHRERGLPATVLGVDAANPTGALGLYESAGMCVGERFTRWERPPRD